MTDTTLNRAGRALWAFLKEVIVWAILVTALTIINRILHQTISVADDITFGIFAFAMGLYGAWYVFFKPAVDAWKGTK